MIIPQAYPSYTVLPIKRRRVRRGKLVVVNLESRASPAEFGSSFLHLHAVLAGVGVVVHEVLSLAGTALSVLHINDLCVVLLALQHVVQSNVAQRAKLVGQSKQVQLRLQIERSKIIFLLIPECCPAGRSHRPIPTSSPCQEPEPGTHTSSRRLSEDPRYRPRSFPSPLILA